MAERRTRRGVALLAPEDWMDAALAAMARSGIGAVNIDTLKGQLGVSRGSFYWHFESRDDLLRRALDRWYELATEDVLAKLATSADPRIRLRRLFIAAYEDRDNGMLYAALVASSDHHAVHEVLERTTRRRLGFLQGCFEALGAGPVHARQRALMAYSLYTGLYDVLRALPEGGRVDYDDAALRAYLEWVCEVLIPGWPPSRAEERG